LLLRSSSYSILGGLYVLLLESFAWQIFDVLLDLFRGNPFLAPYHLRTDFRGNHPFIFVLLPTIKAVSMDSSHVQDRCIKLLDWVSNGEEALLDEINSLFLVQNIH